MTSSRSRIRASGVARTQPSAAARRSATAASSSATAVASGTGRRGTYGWGPAGMTGSDAYGTGVAGDTAGRLTGWATAGHPGSAPMSRWLPTMMPSAGGAGCAAAAPGRQGARRPHPGRVGYRWLAPRPNQRTWRSVPNLAFSAAVSAEGSVNVPVGWPGVEKKSTETPATSWLPNSIQHVPVPS